VPTSSSRPIPSPQPPSFSSVRDESCADVLAAPTKAQHQVKVSRRHLHVLQPRQHSIIDRALIVRVGSGYSLLDHLNSS
jgi:hypothetical protein